MEIESKVRRIYERIKDNDRDKSWEHCKNFFDQNREAILKGNLEKKDLMCLHLGFYLASWGMYRGSSFLLNYDYKVHSNVVDIIVKEEYKDLWNYNPSNEKNDEYILDLLFGTKKDVEDNKKEKNPKKWCGLVGKIEEAYKGYNNNKKDKDNIATDTLITKILIGTLGCIPAYDSLLKKGISYENSKSAKKILTQELNRNGFSKLLKFARENFNEIKEIKYNENRLYPVMKLVDMYLWEIGFSK